MRGFNILKIAFIFMVLVGCSPEQKEQSVTKVTGTLHKSSALEWSKATYENRLATSLDFAASLPKVSDLVLKSGSIETIKPFGLQMVTCIDKSVKGLPNETLVEIKSAELASACAILMKWN